LSILKKAPQPATTPADASGGASATSASAAKSWAAEIPVIVQRHTGEKWLSIAFIAPALIFLLLTNVYPLLYSLRLSFYSWNMMVPLSVPKFVGVENYTDLPADPVFLIAVQRTLIFVIAAVAIEFVIGMGLALLATSRIRAMGVIRTVLLVPLMMTPVVAGILWRTIYHPQYGVVNWLIGLVGIPPQTWLGNPNQALPAVIAVEVWQQLPVVIFVLAAGIQSLPTDLYKAAEVDGSSHWQTFRYITLPLLKPVIIVILMLRIMDAFKIFDIIYMLTYGGPGRQTEVMSMLIYKQGLKYFQVGEAAAMSWVFLLAIFLISLYFIRKLLRGN
jgi:multiple sugar transport system permease protein